MAKPKVATNKAEAFEMIELAIDDLSVLARAFDVISEVCKGEESIEVQSEQVPQTLWN